MNGDRWLLGILSFSVLLVVAIVYWHAGILVPSYRVWCEEHGAVYERIGRTPLCKRPDGFYFKVGEIIFETRI